MSEDLLEALLRAALAEPATLDESNRKEFAQALRARAAQILAERVRPLEERAAAFEKEIGWRTAVVSGLEKEKAGLEKESAWRAETVAALEKEKAGLEKEKEHWIGESNRRQREIEELKREREVLIAEKTRTSEAHDRLLAHHQAILLRLVKTLEAMPAGLPWGYRRVRAQIAELLEVLRRDRP